MNQTRDLIRETFGDELRSRIITVGPELLSWPFRNDSIPCYAAKGLRGSGSASPEDLDPTPCYGHDEMLVARTAAHVEERFPIPLPPTYHLGLFESMSRTNGHMGLVYHYDKETGSTKEPYIWLSGKRIPPHPAMTRYLVAHEYGHCVDDAICAARGLKESGLDEHYAALRGLDPVASKGYGSGKWHANVGELIANDFRILVCAIEPEFWPHPGIARPETVPAIVDWWKAAMECAHRPKDDVKEAA